MHRVMSEDPGRRRRLHLLPISEVCDGSFQIPVHSHGSCIKSACQALTDRCLAAHAWGPMGVICSHCSIWHAVALASLQLHWYLFLSDSHAPQDEPQATEWGNEALRDPTLQVALDDKASSPQLFFRVLPIAPSSTAVSIPPSLCNSPWLSFPCLQALRSLSNPHNPEGWDHSLPA